MTEIHDHDAVTPHAFLFSFSPVILIERKWRMVRDFYLGLRIQGLLASSLYVPSFVRQPARKLTFFLFLPSFPPKLIHGLFLEDQTKAFSASSCALSPHLAQCETPPFPFPLFFSKTSTKRLSASVFHFLDLLPIHFDAELDGAPQLPLLSQLPPPSLVSLDIGTTGALRSV